MIVEKVQCSRLACWLGTNEIQVKHLELHTKQATTARLAGLRAFVFIVVDSCAQIWQEIAQNCVICTLRDNVDKHLIKCFSAYYTSACRSHCLCLCSTEFTNISWTRERERQRNESGQHKSELLGVDKVQCSLSALVCRKLRLRYIKLRTPIKTTNISGHFHHQHKNTMSAFLASIGCASLPFFGRKDRRQAA